MKDDLRKPIQARGTLDLSFDDTEDYTARRRRGGSRLRVNGTDVVFYLTEGVFNVAHQDI